MLAAGTVSTPTGERFTNASVSVSTAWIAVIRSGVPVLVLT